MDLRPKEAKKKSNTEEITWKQSQEKLYVKYGKEIQEKIEVKEEKRMQENLVINNETDTHGDLDDLHCGSDFWDPDKDGKNDTEDKTNLDDLHYGSDFCVSETQEELHELNCGSDFRNDSSFDCLQEDIAEVYKSIQTLLGHPAFVYLFKQYSKNIDDFKKRLEFQKHLMKADCAIVIAGETSTGKSSIINRIIGKNIVPAGIMETTRVCRIKYSDKMQVSTLDNEGKELVRTKINDDEQLRRAMEDLARTDDHQIEYIDVWFPSPILKGNIMVVICNTPKKSDTEKDGEEQKLMDYLSQAVAFIFVVDVTCGVGFQDDRLPNIFKRVRESINQEHYFDPKDAIFLLNNWDQQMHEQQENKIHGIWEDFKDSNILKFSPSMEDYEVQFDKFYKLLKEVITKTESKILEGHFGFIKAFVDACEMSLSKELIRTRQKIQERIKIYDQLSRELEEVRNKRREVYSTFQESVEQFLEDITEDLYQYIHSKEFKSIVLDGIERYTRFTIGRELDTRIEKATLYRQQEKIVLFERKTLQNIAEKFAKIHQSLHDIRDHMKGLKSPFDVEDRLGSVLVSLMAPSSTAVAGSLAMMYMFASPKAAQAVAAAGVVSGLVFTGLVALDFFDDYETVIKGAYKARIDKMTKGKIKVTLQTNFADRFIHVVESYLKGDLKREMDDLSESVNLTQRKINSYKKEETGLLSMRTKISDIRNRFKEIKRIDIKLD